MKIIIRIIILICVTILFGCSEESKLDNNKNGISNNALLAKMVKIQDRIAFKNSDNPEWVSGLNHQKFVNEIFENVFNGKFTKFQKHYYTVTDELFTLDEVKERLGMKIDPDIQNTSDLEPLDSLIAKKEIDLTEISEIIFLEEWNFSKVELNFNKKVNNWSFVREYYITDDIEKKHPRFKMVFTVKDDSTSYPEIEFAKNFIYTFDPEHEYLDRVGFDKSEFFKFLLDKISEGHIIAYDPIYLIDGSKRSFTPKQLQDFAGISFNPEEFDSEIYKFIFIEDWFYDNKTFNIRKEVNGLGFVADRRVDGEGHDKILFFVFFD